MPRISARAGANSNPPPLPFHCPVPRGRGVCFVFAALLNKKAGRQAVPVASPRPASFPSTCCVLPASRNRPLASTAATRLRSGVARRFSLPLLPCHYHQFAPRFSGRILSRPGAPLGFRSAKASVFRAGAVISSGRGTGAPLLGACAQAQQRSNSWLVNAATSPDNGGFFCFWP